MSRRSARSAAASTSAAADPLASLFASYAFSVTPRALKQHPSLEKDIAAKGGTVTATVNKATTHVIALSEEAQAPAGKVKTAASKNLVVLSPEFVIKSIDAGKLEDVAAHTLADATPAPAPTKTVTAIKKGKTVVDHLCPKARTAHVVETPEVFDAMLNQTEISANNNKFYIVRGSSTHFTSTLLILRTVNHWSNRHNFNKVPGKYFMLERSFEPDEEEEEDKPVDPAAPAPPIPPSKLKKPVKELMNLIFNMDMYNSQMAEIGYDAKKMPLGKLSKANIQKGYDVLTKIADVLQSTTATNRSQLERLSSDFYTIIPHEFGMRRPEIIATPQQLKQKIEMVEALADIQIATNILKATGTVLDENPADVNYRSLKCDIEPVDHDSETFKMVTEYTARTHGHTHNYYDLEVLDVFDMARHGEEDRFKDFKAHEIENHMLLWHGSRLTNFVGIISQGLRIAPPEAPVSGYMFGKGVYFADMNTVLQYNEFIVYNVSQIRIRYLVKMNVIHGQDQQLFEPEIHPKLKHKTKGTVSMALIPHDGRLMAASQFLITLTDGPLTYLDGKQAIFGQVAEGMDVLDKINDAICDNDGRPYRDIRIKHTFVIEDPFDDPPGIVIPDRSPIPTEEMLKSTRIGEDEPLHPEISPEELENARQKQEADARALTLEMIGDLPFADVKPPENVLFVCKLNPVTRDEDLELIFSRFGKILSCEIIRDKKTNESLCYSFIEFDTKEACEEAYAKMDNVLIDERRIHVDFSQSVSKLHKEFLLGKRGQADNFGSGLQRRRRYRDDDANPDEKHYDLVFEHDDTAHGDKIQRVETSAGDDAGHRKRPAKFL
eukprot:jgi/Hompol1/5951/HPOL_001834-RA